MPTPGMVRGLRAKRLQLHAAGAVLVSWVCAAAGLEGLNPEKEPCRVCETSDPRQDWQELVRLSTQPEASQAAFAELPPS
uniref:Uncharacterized protein n=1 Tax=Dromaius novaehollandiae TaxID=8790 RepID=A0A8C4K0Y6_DRONO